MQTIQKRCLAQQDIALEYDDQNTTWLTDNWLYEQLQETGKYLKKYLMIKNMNKSYKKQY